MDVTLYACWETEEICTKQELNEKINKKAKECELQYFIDIVGDSINISDVLEELWEVLIGSTEKREQYIKARRKQIRQYISDEFFDTFEEISVNKIGTEDIKNL